MSVLLYGDMLELLPLLPENSIDSCVCDPPYNLESVQKRFGAKNAAPAKHGTDGAFARQSKGFMGQTWDDDIAFRKETWERVYRVLKPGAYLFACSGSRTFHRAGVAIEDAGFIMHPMHGWIYGQGLPKGHAIDDPAWEGWKYGTQSTKPALEPIIMAQKPFSERTGTANVQRWGTGALNIEVCRIDWPDGKAPRVGTPGWGGPNKKLTAAPGVHGNTVPREGPNKLGRYPANLIHDGSDEVIDAFPIAPGQQGDLTGHTKQRPTKTCYGDMGPAADHMRRNDSGSAARFFYAAKATKAERAGSGHPTVKPLALMRYLCRLITPPGGVVLDPFAGSGTTLQAAVQEGFQAIGVEKEEPYMLDIVRRLRAAA